MPSLAPGVVTVVGLANDGPLSSAPYFQLVFDVNQFGPTAFGVQLGGGPNLFGAGISSKMYTVNVMDISYFQSVAPLQSLNSTVLNYKI